MNQQTYEQELAERQRKHYEEIEKHAQANKPEWKPCLDDDCQTCHGTLLKVDGSPCIHYHRCDCPRCRERPSFRMSEFFLKQDIKQLKWTCLKSEGIDSLTKQPVYRQIQLTPCIGTPMP